MTTLPSLVAFGSLAPWPTQDRLQQLRVELRQNSLFQPLMAALHDIALLWEDLASRDPTLNAVAGKNAVDQLTEMINGAVDVQISDEKRNIMVMPMTIITHIVQYFSYLEHSEVSHNSILESVATGGGIQGFCAGLLSALAVASGKTEAEVVAFAATSVKLAFCVGAYVDLEQIGVHGSSEASNLAVRWKGPTTFEDIQRILLNHPNTHVSVVRDIRDVTVTTSTSMVPMLQKDLSGNGVSLRDTGLSGRYHASIHGEIPAKILNACHGRLNPRFGDQQHVRSNTDARILPRDHAIRMALESILRDQANWYLTISTSASALTEIPGNPFILSIGADAIPQSVMRNFPVVKVRTIMPKANGISNTLTSPSKPGPEKLADGMYRENSIAVIGMSCKFPGADSIDEFWSVLTEGKSMLGQMPKERFDIDDLKRTPRGLSFWGNFVRDIESFDHKFFKKSAREAASMDPQQRLLLQVTYQALESSGYFSVSSKPRNVGCYIGACATDYDSNIASHPPTAYSTIGTLRAFLSGKLSHYFGWSGPSLTFDTACSSSAVAIHTACTALQMGECSQAVAGGVTLFTSPYLYENLAAAHFLSPSGATKPFDESADGYCRGEGVGLVVLKKLSDALADGDNVLGVIAGSAINQNENCVPITVPHSSSQGSLYQRVANQAGVTPHKVTFVEAHGTGTPVGDPIEMESIRRIFGGPKRSTPLFVTSVKGNIGHLEGASGVAALIKSLLQMEYRTACIQASFKKLNPKIPSLEADQLCIPTSNRALSGDIMTACINNYGAAGSNAAMILVEAPYKQKLHRQAVDEDPAAPLSRLPIQIAAASTTSLVKYCESFDDFCQKALSSLNDAQQTQLFPSVAFSLARQQNQGLAHMLTLASTNINQFRSDLRKQINTNNAIEQRPKELPLILCFGGQVGEHIALNKRLWQRSSLFRFHMDRCHETLRSMGYPGLYPIIFQTEPITNIVALQPAVFSMQYSCAHAWLDSGLKVDGLVGHSLGQITALCVSGILSLHDGLKLVAGRARLMEEHWGSDPGTMVAIEADQRIIEGLTKSLTVAAANHSFEVACYNGPSSHVLVSDKASADQLEVELKRLSLRHKRLNVTHGFHSRFTEPLIPHLEILASSLTLSESKIPIETCTDGMSWPEPTPQLIAAHTRDPVFFGQAVQRIQNKFGPCTFLEAGSDSSVISMVRRALGQSTGVLNNFIPMELTKTTSLENLVDTTINLWNCGHQVQFWNFHRLQALEYDVFRLPSYQFEKPKHWLKLDVTPTGQAPVPHSGTVALAQPQTPVLIRLQSADLHGQNFHVDSRSEEYQTLVRGHVVLGKSECLLSLYAELVSRAVKTAEESKEGKLVSVQNLQIESPLGLATNREINLQLQRLGDRWNFKVTSKPRSGDSKNLMVACHATGQVSLQASDSGLKDEFARYERLIGQENFSAVLNDADGTSIKGSMVYKVASKIEEYADFYRNVKSITSSGFQVVGKVLSPQQIPECLKGSILQPYILDSFIQVAGLHANCIYEPPEDQIFWISGVDRVQFGPEYQSYSSKSTADIAWDVLCFVSTNTRGLSHDIFVFDATTRRLTLLLLGARYITTSRASLVALLSLTDEGCVDATAFQKKTEVNRVISLVDEPEKMYRGPPVPSAELPQIKATEATKDPRIAIYGDFCTILENIADVPRNEVKGNASFDDLGVDSLMMIEVIAEVSHRFKIELPIEDLEELTDIDSLVKYLYGRGCRGSGARADVDSSVSSSPFDLSSSDDASTTSSLSNDETSGVAGNLSKLVTEHLELEFELALTSNLADHGLDSLLCIELASDIQKMFQVDVDMEKLDHTSTFGTLLGLVLQDGKPRMTAKDIAPPDSSEPDQAPIRSSTVTRPQNSSINRQAQSKGLRVAQQVFENIRFDFDKYSEQTKFNGFWKNVYPEQANLVEAYIIQTFRELGCDMTNLANGQQLPPVEILPKHGHLMNQLLKILVDGGILELQSDSTHVRTTKPLDPMPAVILFERMLRKYPQHSSETKLLNVSGSRLTECLTGKTDPLQLLFANRANREIMADVYENAPMCQATTRLLANFLAKSITDSQSDEIFHILEVGAGTGGTAKYVIDFLISQGIKFEYTFTDISLSLVSQAKKKFAGYNTMKFMALDCDRAPPAELCNKFDIVIATNCIHATKNATLSAANIALLLREDGFFCLVEFTNGLYWFDLVYGLLEGWWAFTDGRQHALADQWFWDNCLQTAGFKHVSWTDGSSSEAQTMRLICGFKATAEKDSYKPMSRSVTKRAGVLVETFTWKRVGNLELQADVYFPKIADGPAKKRPIALMIHGGGHLLFSRQDIPMKHVRVLLQRGFLPVSVDYRLCPELSLFDGPVTDCCDALQWARETLPSLTLAGPNVTIDTSKLSKGIKPPEVILPFYSPSDLEAEFWNEPIFPEAAEEPPTEIWGVLDCVREEPILEYTPMSNKRATALSLTLKDDRARLILHMNWKAQSVNILIHGLPHKNRIPADDKTDWKALPKPPVEKIRECSPYWHILQGDYRTPTFMVHGNIDDWIPYQMTQKTIAALQERDVPSGIIIPDQCGHAFDLFPKEDRLGVGWSAIEAAYDFACGQLAMSF